MRAAWYERGGPADEVLTVGEMDTPRPGPGEVLVRVQASGVIPGMSKTAPTGCWTGKGPTYRRIGQVWSWHGSWSAKVDGKTYHGLKSRKVAIAKVELSIWR